MSASSPAAPGPATLPQIAVSGDFATRVTYLTQSESTLLLGLGTLEGETPREVIVPYLELRLEGHQAAEEPEAAQALLSAVLPLEIAVSFLAGLAADLQSACGRLASIGGGPLAPEPLRLTQAEALLAGAMTDLQAAREALRALAQAGEAAG